MCLVSIVIPVYNVQDYVYDSIKSVLNQTFQSLEIIIVNDGSTDDSLENIKMAIKGDSRVRLISQPNQGLSAARNTGLSKAQGDYIYFFDSDDLLNVNLIKASMNQFKLFPNAGAVVFGNTTSRNMEIAESHTPVPYKVPTKVNAGKALELVMQKQLPITSWSFIIKRNIMIQNEIYFPVGRLYEDVFTTAQIYKLSNDIIILPYKNSNPWYWYRTRDSSIMANTKKNWSWKNTIDYFEAYNCFFATAEGLVDENISKEWLLNNYFFITTNSYNTLNKLEWGEMVKLIANSPISDSKFLTWRTKIKKFILTKKISITILKMIMRNM